MTDERKQAEASSKVRQILQDYHRRDDYSLESAESDILSLFKVAEAMPTEEERDEAAMDCIRNDDMLYELEIFKAGWDACRNRMKEAKTKTVEMPTDVAKTETDTGHLIDMPEVVEYDKEVERRIASRMPTEEEAINMALDYVRHKDLKPANRGLIKDAIIIGINMVRNRMKEPKSKAIEMPTEEDRQFCEEIKVIAISNYAADIPRLIIRLFRTRMSKPNTGGEG